MASSLNCGSDHNHLMDNDKKSPEESFDPHCTFGMVILNISATVVNFLYKHMIRSNGSISELHKSLDMMTDNLNQMCMTLQTKLEEQMHTVAKMNSVMESYILKHIEVSRNDILLGSYCSSIP